MITASELPHGIHRALAPDIALRRSAFVEAILDRCRILPVDLPTARTHSLLRAQLLSTGALIGAPDLWLAATCLAHGLTIVTFNVREFERVPNLGVEVWADAG